MPPSCAVASGSGFRVWSMMVLVGIALFCCGIFSAWAADDHLIGISGDENFFCGLLMLNLALIGAKIAYGIAGPNAKL